MNRTVRHLLCTAIVAGGLSLAAAASAATPAFNTITPGVIHVTIEPYMPYTAAKDGKLIGIDSDILLAIARKLDLKVTYSVTNFAGMLASVQSRRADVSIGGIAWTASRQKQGLFTDPVYYSPPAIAVNKSTTFANPQQVTLKELQGKKLGTVTGYIWAKALHKIPKAEVKLYPNSIGVFSDLSTGRLDVGFLDPLLISYEQRQRPNLHFNIDYLVPPTEAQIKAHPTYTAFVPYMVSFYIPRQEPRLEKAMSAQIDAMYKNGELAAILKKWGADPAQFLKPSPALVANHQRVGVDRPTGWTLPSAGK